MKISIITITFNSEETIEETILSIINQNYDELEYIIIDGGSTDNTLDIINKYKGYITSIISEPDKGISDAFNKGINLAKGEIVGIINSDDLLNIGTLKVIEKTVKEFPNYDAYYGNVVVFDNKKNHVNKPINDIQDIKKYMFINHPAVFVRKTAYEKYGVFDIKYKCAMDFELLSRMYLNGARFKYFDYNCAWFRLGGVSNTQRKRTQEECEKIAIRNGIEKKEAEQFYNKIEKKQKYIDFSRKIGIENILRKTIKKQEKSRDSREWYKKNNCCK